MDILHITPEKNIPSIMKNGIRRSKPLLSQYNRVMKYLYDDEYDEKKGLIFCFPEEIFKRDKYIKDFCYWKTWGEIRNRILHPLNDEDFIKHQELGCNYFYGVKPKLQRLKILLLDIKFEDFFTYYNHVQTHLMSNYWSDMDERYEHCSKPLVLVNYDIKPDSIKRVVGTVESFLEKGKINTTLEI